MKLAAKLDDIVTKIPSPGTSSANDYDVRREGSGGRHGVFGALSTQDTSKHIDVHEEEGWITIPCKELPDGWSEDSDMSSFRSLDRPFVFPGEQVHILACLSTCKQESEMITSFNLAEVKSSNSGQSVDQKNNSARYSALRTKEHKRESQELLKRFRNSHFFARIAEAGESLWSRRKTDETFRGSTATIGGNFLAMESREVNKNATVDRGSLDASTSGGVAKNDVKCNLLPNGDIVVLLQVNIGVEFLTDPVLEILQFEKHDSTTLTSENSGNSKEDPYGDLLKWLLPVQHSIISQPTYSWTPEMSPNSSARNSLTKANSPGSLGSQNYLLGHLRSHSMSSLSSKNVPPTLPTSSSRPNIALEDCDQFKNFGIEKSEELLSFRGVLLEPDRFSVRCGLEGIYLPGRRWRRKIEIIQPLEIHCFDAECNTEDLLCVQIKNVSPAHAPDIVIYLDAITVICEKASKDGAPSSLPITCIEAGNDHGLPGLALRKGEEHSFILKPATSLSSCNTFQLSELKTGSARSSVYSFTNTDRGPSTANRYALLVSCRSNYTESRLFFKQPTKWQPHIQKDVLISVTSQMSSENHNSDGIISQLPIQILTLEASNLTNENLNLTLVASPSVTSSMVSLNCSPASPFTPFDRTVSTDLQRLCSVTKMLDQRYDEDTDEIISNVVNDSGHSHLWLESRVPLGCVPSRSTVTVKLELLPLTDGIITLDSLQINVERGVSYVPEHPLKINGTSSISIGVI